MQIEEIARRSRRAAILAAIGFLFVFGALAFSAYIVDRRDEELINRQEQLDKANRDLIAEKKRAQSAQQAVELVASGVNAIHMHDYDKAIDFYNKALDLDPNNAQILDLKGYALFKKGEFDEAIITLKASVIFEPNNPWQLLNLTKAYCATSKFHDAKATAEQIIVQIPSFTDTMMSDGEFKRLCKPIISELVGF